MARRGTNSPIPTVGICMPDGANHRIVNQTDFISVYRSKGYIPYGQWKKSNQVQLTDAELKEMEEVTILMRDAPLPETPPAGAAASTPSAPPPSPSLNAPPPSGPVGGVAPPAGSPATLSPPPAGQGFRS